MHIRGFVLDARFNCAWIFSSYLCLRWQDVEKGIKHLQLRPDHHRVLPKLQFVQWLNRKGFNCLVSRIHCFLKYTLRSYLETTQLVLFQSRSRTSTTTPHTDVADSSEWAMPAYPKHLAPFMSSSLPRLCQEHCETYILPFLENYDIAH